MRPFKFDVEAEGREHFIASVNLCLQLGEWDKGFNKVKPALGFFFVSDKYAADPYSRYSLSTDPNPKNDDFLALVNYFPKTNTPNPFRFPFPIQPENIGSFLWNYASDMSTCLADYGGDGTLKEGWQVCNPESLRIYDNSAVIAVRPRWILYGK